MDKKIKHFFAFGDFRIDTEERILLFKNKHLHLSPKVFDTLLLLVQKSGQIVEKNELMKTLWPDTFVEEANLSHNISLLRKIFAASDSNEQYIQTVPKRGYRFIADVRELHLENIISPLIKDPDIVNIDNRIPQITDGGTPALVSKWQNFRQKMWKIPLIIGVFISLFIMLRLEPWKQKKVMTPQDPQISEVINLSPLIAGQQCYIQINGQDIDPDKALVVVTGRGCENFGSCNIPNNVLHWYGNVTSSQIERVPMTLAPGDFQIFVQNGLEGKISNAARLTINVE